MNHFLLLLLLALQPGAAHAEIEQPGVSQSGAVVVDNCVKWAGNGVIADAGAACGSGSGPSGSSGAIQFTNGVAFDSDALLMWDDTNKRVGIGTGTPGATLHLAGNQSSAAWTTNGIALRSAAATYTDTTSSGTVPVQGVYSLGTPTMVASSATTYTDSATLYIAAAPVASTNVTQTRTNAIYIASGGIRIVSGNLTLVSGNITTTGANTAQNFVPSANTIPTNGMYLPVANTVGWATNTTAAGIVDATQHWRLGGTASAAIGTGATCGTSPSITGTDRAGVFTTGSGVLTSCQVFFASTWVTAPRQCQLTPADAAAAATGTTGAYISAITTTSFTVTGLNLTSASYYYFCE